MRTAIAVLALVAAAACTHTPPASPDAATPPPSAAPAASPAATATTTAASADPIKPNAVVAKEWDPALAALVGRATTMRAARVKMNQATDALTFGPDVAADALARRAATAILTTPTDARKRCGFDPGVALRLCDDQKDCATVLLCFSCMDLAVQTADKKIVGMLDFQPSKAEFAAIAKAALPNDPEIQKL